MAHVRSRDRGRVVMAELGAGASGAIGLSVSRVAEMLGVSVATVRRWADLGHLASYRTPGGQRRFSREQVDAFLESRERRCASHGGGASHTRRSRRKRQPR